MTRLRKALVLVGVNVLVVVLLLALLEGAASLLFVTHEIVRTPGVPEDAHAAHDELLGWANLPNVDLPDFYGPGVGVQTNAQGFRGSEDITPAIPPGTLRIVCSGDSFTFGYGVGNDETWCQGLETLDPSLQTVNMGLGGYGVDQTYLWYRRDGTRLDHDLQLFSVLTDDFRRMRSDRFMGYGKPLLAVRNDSLVITNLPVPRTSWVTRRRALHGETLGRLNMVRLARRLLGLDDAPDADAIAQESERLRTVAALIFRDLDALNRARHSRLVLVYLPGAWDYRGEADTDAWRTFVRDEAARRGITLFDLVEELRRVPPTEVDALYAPNAHFSVAGNAWAAQVLHRRLQPLLDSMRVDTVRSAR